MESLNSMLMIQDTLIPIYIFLEYEGKVLKFPVNPESIKKEVSSQSNTVEIEGLGEVSQQTTPKLARINISSFFWQEMNLLPSAMYVNWLDVWQKSKKPAHLVVTRLNYSMEVTCESFNHWINAGEEEDIYFELQLLEYRKYGAKKLKDVTDKTILEKARLLKNKLTPSILIEIPRPTRSSIGKLRAKSPYMTINGETLLSIAKKITGSTDKWKDLYESNRNELGDIFESNDSIPEGTKLTIPDNWSGESYVLNT